MFVRVDAVGPQGQGLPPTTHDASDRAVIGATQPRAYTAYTDPSGVFTVGVWACDAGTLAIDDLAIDEACYLIDGEVIITDAHGNSERFVAGDFEKSGDVIADALIDLLPQIEMMRIERVVEIENPNFDVFETGLAGGAEGALHFRATRCCHRSQ